MSDINKKKAGWKQKLLGEMLEYWINVFYLIFLDKNVIQVIE